MKKPRSKREGHKIADDRLSLYGLTPEEALKKALSTTAPKSEKAEKPPVPPKGSSK